MGQLGRRRRARRERVQESPDSPRKPPKKPSFSFPVVHPNQEDLVPPSVYKSGVMRTLDPPAPDMPPVEPSRNNIFKVLKEMAEDIETLSQDVHDLKQSRAYTICMYNPDAKLEYRKLKKEIERSHKKGKELKVGRWSFVLKYGCVVPTKSMIIIIYYP